MDESDVTSVLEQEYGILATRVTRHGGGWEADAFVVENRWFVKAWRYEPPANLALLADLADRGLPVVPPLLTMDGRHSTSTCAVYPFVSGRPAPDDGALLGRTLRRIHAVTDVDLPEATLEEWCIPFLREHRQHEWLADRSDELMSAVDRLEAVIETAQQVDAEQVLVHNDLYEDNMLVDNGGELLAILDWDHAKLGPKEHDLWLLADTRSDGLIEAYGPTEVNLVHLEYALLARALRDLAVRVNTGKDPAGVDTWGFRRLGRVDAVLERNG